MEMYDKVTIANFSIGPTEDFYNSTDYYDDICNKTEVTQFASIITPVFFSIVILFSCVGNTLVLCVLIKYEKLSSLTNVFLLNLAISDLIFTVGLPFWAFDNDSGWIFSELTCKAVSFIFFLGYYSSLLFLTVMTVHRYMAVVHPMSVIINRKPHYSIVTSALIWLISFCAATPDIIFKRVVEQDSVQYCTYESDTSVWKLVAIYQQNVFFLAAFIIIAFCYICILQRLLRPMSHTRPKTVKLILCIVTVFYLGWTPYNVTIFLDALVSWKVSPVTECHASTTIDYVFYISRLLAFSHCCLNPVFYVFMGIKFRSHLKTMLSTFCQQGAQAQNRHSRLIYSNGEEVSMY